MVPAAGTVYGADEASRKLRASPAMAGTTRHACHGTAMLASFAAVSWSAAGALPAMARHRWRHCGPDAGRPASGRSSPRQVHWPGPCSSAPCRQPASSRLAQARQSCPQPALLLAGARAAPALAVHWARGVLVTWLPAGDWLRLTGPLHSCGRSAVLPRVSAFLPGPAPGRLQGRKLR